MLDLRKGRWVVRLAEGEADLRRAQRLRWMCFMGSRGMRDNGTVLDADAHDAARAGNEHLDVAGVAVAVVAGQAAHNHLVEGALGEDGDAVETLLAVHGGIVAELLEGLGGKRLGG